MTRKDGLYTRRMRPFPQARFLTSAAAPAQFPADHGVEVAFAAPACTEPSVYGSGVTAAGPLWADAVAGAAGAAVAGGGAAALFGAAGGAAAAARAAADISTRVGTRSSRVFFAMVRSLGIQTDDAKGRIVH